MISNAQANTKTRACGFSMGSCHVEPSSQESGQRLLGAGSGRARRVAGKIEQRRKDNQDCEPKCNAPALHPVAYAHPTCHRKND